MNPRAQEAYSVFAKIKRVYAEANSNLSLESRCRRHWQADNENWENREWGLEIATLACS